MLQSRIGRFGVPSVANTLAIVRNFSHKIFSKFGDTTGTPEETGSTTFSEVRVESPAFDVAVVRWKYTGANTINVYRSSDGVTYAEVGSDIAVGTVLHIDSTVAAGTRYWYKITDDNGSTFSSVVTVVVQVCGGNNSAASTFALPRFDGTEQQAGDLNDLAQKVEGMFTSQVAVSEPCVVCAVDGALILDCTSGCNEFIAVATSDINSISTVNCPRCPDLSIIIPPNADIGICGWPENCGFHGDECFEGRIAGGPEGKTLHADGSTSEGYGLPGSSGTCPCNSALTAGCVTDCLRITCCSDDCELNCGDTIKLKACGGYGPYTWSNTGTGILSSKKGTGVSITKKQVAGLVPGTSAYITPRIKYKNFFNAAACGDGTVQGCPTISGQSNIVISTDTSATDRRWDCDQNALSDGIPFAGYPNNRMGTLLYGGDICPAGADTDADFGTSTDECTDEGAAPAASFQIQVVPAGETGPNGIIHANAATYLETQVLAPTGSSLVALDFSDKIDVRSQTMVTDGCCLDEPETVTVTDRVGVSATVVLHT